MKDMKGLISVLALVIGIGGFTAIPSTSEAGNLGEPCFGYLPEICEAPSATDGNTESSTLSGGVAADTEVADKLGAIKDRLTEKFGERKAGKIMSHIEGRLTHRFEHKFGEDTPAIPGRQVRNGGKGSNAGGEGRTGGDGGAAGRDRGQDRS